MCRPSCCRYCCTPPPTDLSRPPQPPTKPRPDVDHITTTITFTDGSSTTVDIFRPLDVEFTYQAGEPHPEHYRTVGVFSDPYVAEVTGHTITLAARLDTRWRDSSDPAYAITTTKPREGSSP